MKVSIPSEYGNKGKNKIVLPLIPEQVEVAAKADLAQVDLLSDPALAHSTKVRFVFKIIEGAVNPPREVLQWRRNVERAFTGLNCTSGTAQHQMLQQFCRGTALSTYNNQVHQLYLTGKNNDVKEKEDAVKADDGTDAARLANLQAAVTTAENKTQEEYLADGDDGRFMVDQALNHMMTVLLPNKILQRVKRYLRREARKPYDMDVKTYYMHIQRINGEEILKLPPKFEKDQSLGNRMKLLTSSFSERQRVGRRKWIVRVLTLLYMNPTKLWISWSESKTPKNLTMIKRRSRLQPKTIRNVTATTTTTTRTTLTERKGLNIVCYTATIIRMTLRSASRFKPMLKSSRTKKVLMVRARTSLGRTNPSKEPMTRRKS